MIISGTGDDQLLDWIDQGKRPQH
uniref:Uncharacterized protein n=1 Tax=Triticum urartu TaxID=4572 RepID=A0A8R7NYH8_TRIUA